MNVIWRRIWRGKASDSWGIRNAALSTLGIVLVLSLCTTGLAQTNATTTITGTAHDFSTADGPGYKVPAGDNHCEVCHGPPTTNPWPEWRHTDSANNYDGTNWLYALGDGGMTAGWMTDDCMGCHAGDTAINDYQGGPDLVANPGDAVYITGTEAFGTFLNTHHPVDITYDAALATAQGALEDPSTFQNPQGGGSIEDTLLHFDFASSTNKLWCKSCHEQHNDRRFDLVGGDPSDDPEPGATSGEHNFLKFDRLCFNCHTHEQPHDGDQHHIPGRADPYGDLRSSDMNCTLCHKITPTDTTGSSHLPKCYDCHNDITRGTAWTVRGTPGTATDIPGGHHGGDRTKPYFDCAACHADPLTGILTGNDFGTLFAKSCYTCHDDLWNDPDHDGVLDNTPPAGLSVAEAVDVGGTPTVYGTVDQALDLTAVVATNTEGDTLAYQWNFGDGTTPPFPSNDPATSHTYNDYQYRGVPLYKASVAVTDGVNPPIVYEFDVVIADAEDPPVADTWRITPSIDSFFDITFENHNGSLVGSTDETPSQLSFGVEFVNVIFWMELWMDLNNDAYWGTGDMFFGNISRGDPGSMDGVLFKADGSVQTFTGSGGAPPEH